MVNSSKKNLLVRPVFRKATLSKIALNLSEEYAWKYAKLFKRHYNDSFDEYLDILTEASDFNANEINFDQNEKIRIIKEETAVVVDGPRVFSKKENSVNFDSRLCTAFCTEERSVKSWMRVSIHYDDIQDKDNYYRKIIDSEKTNILQSLDQIANRCSEWSFQQLKKCLRKKHNDINISLLGHLDIKVFGTDDDDLNSVLNKPENEEKDFKRLLEKPKTHNIIKKNIINSHYSNISFEKIFEEEKDDVFWMFLPLNIEDSEGIARLRNVLFLNFPDGNTIKSIGIGFDDSKLGDLSMISSLRMARWFGKRV